MTDFRKPSGIAEGFFKAVVRLMNVAAVVGLLFLALDPTIGEHLLYQRIKIFSVFPIYAIFLLHLSLAIVVRKSLLDFFQHHFLDLIFFIPLFSLTFGGVHPGHILLLRQFVFYFNRYLDKNTFSHLATAISEKPARLISLSFCGVILTGAFLLVLPVSVASGAKPSFLVALFTSTSAVCVTGLNVIDPGTYFSYFGQVVVVCLIQVGGLGIMTLSAIVAMLIGKRFAITQRTVMQNVLDQTDLASLLNNLKEIMNWTFAIEAIGAAVLAIRFYSLLGCSAGRAIYLGIFHAVSAFCNAGFALFPDNLMGFVEDPIISITVMLLIITGGLGFSVLGNVAGFVLGKRRGPYDIHTVLVTVTTLLLIVGGTIGILLLEMNSPSMRHLNIFEKWLAAAFQSVTTRTAGFNTIDMGILRPTTLFLMVILMFIGASPASTGGGIKTTTFATMWLALNAQMRERSDVVVMERTIPGETVLKAFLITAISVSLVAVFTFLLLLIEDQPPMNLLFEVTSAFGTVGLSVNLTPSLSSLSHVLLIILMYIGRIGPLTLALSVQASNQGGNVHYPSTRILVG